MSSNRSKTIQLVCDYLSSGELGAAESLIADEYPFEPITKGKRKYTPRQMTQIFLRDGFIDRYRGDRLVYPPALRLISNKLPTAFPYHKNGKMDSGHIAYWELFPTIDHVVPVARGGNDDESNWVCCSILTNGIMSNWLLKELQWELVPPGNTKQWDGMLAWFMEQMEQSSDLSSSLYLKTWYNAARDVARNNEFSTTEAGTGALSGADRVVDSANVSQGAINDTNRRS